MEPLGVAIIGSGGISVAHADSFGQFGERVKVMAFTDIDLDRAKSRAEQYNAPIATVDYTELLDRDDIHILAICSPPFHHLQTIQDGLSAGKHVLCEKPIVLNLAELDDVQTSVDKTGLTFAGAFQWRFGTGVLQAKNLYENGMLGKVIYASNNMYWHRTQEYFDVDWRNTWAKSGGGIIFTLACHGMDALMYILGDIEAVSAEMDALKYNIEIEDTGSVIMRFQNRAIGAINATVNAQKQRSVLEVIGTKLEAISSDDPYCVAYEPWQFRSVDADYEKLVHQYLKKLNYEYVPAGHQRLVKDFVEAIWEGRQPIVNIDEIRKSLQVLTAIFKSNRLGRRIELPIKKDDPFYAGLNPESV